MPFDAGYISYVIMVTLGVACGQPPRLQTAIDASECCSADVLVGAGLEGAYLERSEMRLKLSEIKPAIIMNLSDLITDICSALPPFCLSRHSERLSLPDTDAVLYVGRLGQGEGAEQKAVLLPARHEILQQGHRRALRRKFPRQHRRGAAAHRLPHEVL